MPHHPLITGETEGADPGQASTLFAAFSAVGDLGIVAMAAPPGAKGKVLAHRAVPPWIAGLGFAERVA